MAAILKIQNGGRYSSQITCLHFLYDSNNTKLSIHKISCFYDNLNNIATNRSTTSNISQILNNKYDNLYLYDIYIYIYIYYKKNRNEKSKIKCVCFFHIKLILVAMGRYHGSNN